MGNYQRKLKHKEKAKARIEAKQKRLRIKAMEKDKPQKNNDYPLPVDMGKIVNVSSTMPNVKVNIITEGEVCDMCGGSGEVSAMEQVYSNEPHMADIGSEPCPQCSVKDEDEFDNQEE